MENRIKQMLGEYVFTIAALQERVERLQEALEEKEKKSRGNKR